MPKVQRINELQQSMKFQMNENNILHNIISMN